MCVNNMFLKRRKIVKIVFMNLTEKKMLTLFPGEVGEVVTKIALIKVGVQKNNIKKV